MVLVAVAVRVVDEVAGTVMEVSNVPGTVVVVEVLAVAVDVTLKDKVVPTLDTVMVVWSLFVDVTVTVGRVLVDVWVTTFGVVVTRIVEVIKQAGRQY